jgi:hypothetical protein
MFIEKPILHAFFLLLAVHITTLNKVIMTTALGLSD